MLGCGQVLEQARMFEGVREPGLYSGRVLVGRVQVPRSILSTTGAGNEQRAFERVTELDMERPSHGDDLSLSLQK